MHNKRKSRTKMAEGSYLISTKAKEKLQALAMEHSTSVSKTIEMLIVNIDKIKDDAEKLKPEFGTPVQLSEFLEVNKLQDILEKKDNKLKSTLQTLDSKNSQLLAIQKILDSPEKEAINNDEKVRLIEEIFTKNHEGKKSSTTTENKMPKNQISKAKDYMNAKRGNRNSQ